NSFGDAHRSIHHRMLRNPVKKSKLKKPHPHDRQRRGLNPFELASRQMRQLVVEASPPRKRAEHQPRDQPSIGRRKIGQPPAQQNVGIAGLLVDAVQNLSRRHSRREPLVRRRARSLGGRHFRLFFAHVPNRAPASTRLPRRKSAAEILFRPAACTSSSLSRPVPHWTAGFGFRLTIVPGGSLEKASSTAARQMRTSSPPRRVRATGHGSYARVIRSICTAFAVQSIAASFFSTCAVYVAIASSCGVSTSASRAARSIASSIASA